MTPEELTISRAIELLDQGQQDDEPLGICPETHKPVFIKQGRFGPYVQLGLPDDDDKRNASLLRGMEPSEIDLATRSEAAFTAAHARPPSGIAGTRGRLERPLRPLCQMRQGNPLLASGCIAVGRYPRRRPGSAGSTQSPRPWQRDAKEPLKVFEASPVTEEPIKLLAGRYGPYVTDGTTNASLPKGAVPEELTFDQAVQLLADRAAKGGGQTETQEEGHQEKSD